ncbi:MAG: type II secretion system protein GspM [Candidatus Eremiobacteraeota bacterium]|nr:type II secretion system protein GspM [Candidatus Eremiobacteraeota bacterium]
MAMNLKDLSPREKIIYGVGVPIILLMLYVVFFILPSLEHIRVAKKQIAAYRGQWKQIEAEIERYRNLPAVTSPAERVSLLSFLEQSGNNLKIDKKIVYLKPFSTTGNKEGAEVKIDDITGDELIKLIHLVQEARISIVKINVKDHNLDGLWTLKLFLED